MSGIYEAGLQGERLLVAWLRTKGRSVRPSDHKTFDLIVDGKYAEVKSTSKPYAALEFIGLTDNQFAAVRNGQDFAVFLVCNTRDPENLEVKEIPASSFLKHHPKTESTHYWYRKSLDSMLGDA